MPAGRGLVRDRGNGYLQLAGESFETLLADAAATATAGQLLGGFLRQVPTAGRTVTTDTAANIDTAMPDAQVGDGFDVIIYNNSAGAFAITIAAGTGVTLKPTTPATVAQNKTAHLKFVKTGAGAYDCYVIVSA